MRALFMDFPQDPKVADIGDEYMFGPAILVAPVTEQGATSRTVYLPAGTDWYNFWTRERIVGGKTVEVNAPIDTLPLFVRAGSILPLGLPVDNTSQVQKLEKIRVYPGASGDFTLYQDDGKTYAYEKGNSSLTTLHWDDAAGKLTQQGVSVGAVSDLLEVVNKQ
jgi:alpha-D-xyloside xylohydrolase